MGLFSLLKIAEAHYKTLVDESNSKWKIILLFLILPVTISGGLLWFGLFITSDVMTTIISMLAILIGFSINAVFILIDSYPDETTRDIELLFVGTRNITLYSIVFGITTLLLSGLVLVIVLNNNLGLSDSLMAIISSVIFIMVFHYFVTLLLLPARLYAIVEIRSSN